MTKRIYAAVWGHGKRGDVFTISQELPQVEVAKSLKPIQMQDIGDSIPILVEKDRFDSFGRIDNNADEYSIICYSSFEGNFIEANDFKVVADAVKAGVVDG